MANTPAMKKSHFLKLLHKYKNGNPTQEECQFLLKYYNLFESDPGIGDLLTEEQKNELKEQIKASIWNKISFYEHQEKNKKPKNHRKTIGIAASLIILAVLAAGIIPVLDS